MRGRWGIRTLVLAALFVAGEQAFSQGGKEFAPKNQMYTIIMPDGVKSSQQTKILTIGKHRCPIELSQTVLKDGTTFVGGSIGIPAVVIRTIPADQRFDVLRDALVKSLKGKVTQEKDIKYDPVPGKEYQIDLPKGAARMQIYTVAGWVVYAVVEGKTKEQVNSAQANGFYNSLKLTDKAKEVFNQVKR